ncbi:TPA: hypothetical protein ACKE1B_003212 [Klebsiella michiganensis]
MNHTLSDSLLEAMIKSAVNSSGPLPPDEKFSQLVSALRELQERRKAAMDSEPVAWSNGCNKSVPAALRYLAEKPRPRGGESSFNTAHLYQLAREIELMAEAPLYRHAQQPVVPEEMTKSLASIAKEYQTTPQNALFIVVGWNACRAAMLQAGNSPVVPDERAAFNAWNNDVDCPLAGRDAKSAAWLAWQSRAAMLAAAPQEVIGE